MPSPMNAKPPNCDTGSVISCRLLEDTCWTQRRGQADGGYVNPLTSPLHALPRTARATKAFHDVKRRKQAMQPNTFVEMAAC